jgi:hypothetical protein
METLLTLIGIRHVMHDLLVLKGCELTSSVRTQGELRQV